MERNKDIYVEELDMGWDKKNFEDNFNSHNSITDKEWEEIKDKIEWNELKRLTEDLRNFDYDENYDGEDYDEYHSTFDCCFDDVVNYLQSINDDVREKM